MNMHTLEVSGLLFAVYGLQVAVSGAAGCRDLGVGFQVWGLRCRVDWCLFTVYHSPFTGYRNGLLVDMDAHTLEVISCIAVHRLLFAVDWCACTVDHLPFTFDRLRFTVYNLPFTIHPLPLTAYRLGLLVDMDMHTLEVISRFAVHRLVFTVSFPLIVYR